MTVLLIGTLILLSLVIRKKMKKNIRLKGFTLIELLVVIIIISMLALLVIVNLEKSKQKSRDAQRKQDLSLIASSLDSYYSDNKSHPLSSSFASADTVLSTLTTSNYINTIPKDPTGSGSYQYKSDSYQYKIVTAAAKAETIKDLGSLTCQDTKLVKLAGDFCDPVDRTRLQVSSSATALNW